MVIDAGGSCQRVGNAYSFIETRLVYRDAESRPMMSEEVIL
ncbi:hypothetical protein BCEP4_1750013 [Burkholderia cepacia]|nr:hypothetical protein BCEP4_1750013 [Burkholderia cepacia]